jgi:hypothetical protein
MMLLERWLAATIGRLAASSQALHGMDAPILRLDRHSLPQPHILPAAPRVSLEILRGRVRERRREIPGKVFLIGSAADCDLVLGDLQFPEAYAYIFVSGTEVTIRRLGSGPVLAVCGQSVETADLFHGDLLEFGPFELRVIVDYPPRPVRHGGDTTFTEDQEHDDDGQEEAIDEVRGLLSDVRQALAGAPASVRLYREPDDEPAPAQTLAGMYRKRASA